MNHNLRIAIADDEGDMRDYFQMMLPSLGHTVVSAAKTGKELVEQCKKQKPDIASMIVTADEALDG
jgi:CheY-like chemotaxis protein